MTEQEFKDIRQHCFDIKTELQKGTKTAAQCSLIIKKIFVLNASIDKMPEKDSHYYEMVECCYDCYRMLGDHFY